MLKCMVVTLVVAFPSLGWAQDKLQFFPVFSKGQANYVSVLQLEKGWEFWDYRGTAGERNEVISPKLSLANKRGRITAGLYGRWEDGKLARYGVSGVLTLGKKSGWQLTGPYYLFRQRGENGFKDSGLWMPNSRLTRPISDSTRAGVGMALTTIEARKPAIVSRAYLQHYFNKSTNLQLGIGPILAPASQRGDWQLFSGITKEF